jgi:hypothetical protein
LLVVFEPAVTAHALIQRIFAAVAERGVSQVVCEGDAFSEILVETEGPSDGAGD